VFWRSLFVLLSFFIWHFVVCPSSITDFDYPFDIFKLFFQRHMSWLVCVQWVQLRWEMIDRFLGIGLISKCFSECIYKHIVFDYFISDSLLLFLMFYVLLTYLTRRVSLVVEELLTLPENQSSPPFLMGFALLNRLFSV
jgi:hypothetical protein